MSRQINPEWEKLGPEADVHFITAPVPYERGYFQLVYNFATQRYGCFDSTKGCVTAWYESVTDALAALTSTAPGATPPGQ